MIYRKPLLHKNHWLHPSWIHTGQSSTLQDSIWFSAKFSMSSGQDVPPFLPGVQVRTRNFVPSPHLGEHSLHCDHALITWFTGQNFNSGLGLLPAQTSVSINPTLHGSPPFLGGRHSLCLVFCPGTFSSPTHDLEQKDQELQFDKLPSTFRSRVATLFVLGELLLQDSLPTILSSKLSIVIENSEK